MWTRLAPLESERGEECAAGVARARAEALVGNARPASIALSLPFHGQWLVTQGKGGPTHLGGNHYAWHLMRRDARGRVQTGSGAKLEDYPTCGAEVLAMADGVVVETRDASPDHRPGALGPAGGNDVLIARGSGVCSLYCHLRCGSVVVRLGQRVRRGDVIAQVGCSGLAEAPHLHVALVDGPVQRRTLPSAFAAQAVADDGAMRAEAGLVPRTLQVVAAP